MKSVGAVDVAAIAGLSASDYREVCRRLGREPNSIEARMFGVMWSEHCGYKHSKKVLRRLPATSPRVLTGPGENAGVVAINPQWALAFKMESHNHPSAVDPYNGAATGVGGIIRDVLAMGARPIALLDSLRFGPQDEARSRRLFGGVISGIAGYGNAIGVPTVGGELRVDSRYRDNPVVNVACLGLVRTDQVARSAAAGPGNVVLYVGARTGRDGIGGAAFASTELDEGREPEDRASVQMGDPFTGKLLIEATLEARATGAVVAMQDMGAAGLTCATSEMAARGRVGMRIDLERVPLRETGMRDEEVLLSESQERMLLVVPATEADSIVAIYHRWGLVAEVIGTVTADSRLVVTSRSRTIVDLPPSALADAPSYDPDALMPDGLEARWHEAGLNSGWWKETIDEGRPRGLRGKELRGDADSPASVDPAEALLALLRHPDIVSKRAIFEQYDHMVGIRTVTPPGADAAVLRILEASPLGLALTADGNARWCAADPRRGAALCVLEAAANLACVGAEPLAVTDCLNFGNPERPQVFWTFQETVDGIADACRALEVPVVGGNVSFYNEAEGGSGDRAIPPSPTIGMVGLLEDVERTARPGFTRDGDVAVLLGNGVPALGASLYLEVCRETMHGRPADPMPGVSARAIRCVTHAVRAGLLASVHDCSDGGLAVAIAEACVHGGRGASVTAASTPDELFGESPGRFIASVQPERLPALEALAQSHGVSLVVLGTTGGTALRITPPGHSPARSVELPVSTLADAWNSLEV